MIRSLILGSAITLIIGATAWAQAGYTLEFFNVPYTDYTSAGPINNSGDVAGFSGKLNPDGSYAYVGFLRSVAGVYTTLVPPGAAGGIFASGLNNWGNVVGTFDTAGGDVDGFVYKDGKYKTVRIKDSTTDLYAINDKGAIVGGFNAAPASFVATPNGTFHFIEYPGAESSAAFSINNRGDIIGSYLDFSGFLVYGFLLSDGVFTSIGYPGSLNTELTAINNAGTIVGWYQLNSGYYRGFIYKSGHFSTFEITGSLSTYVEGINDLGQLSGDYVDSSNVQHGFIATPLTK